MPKGDVVYRPSRVERRTCKPPLRCAVYQVSGDEGFPRFDHWRECSGVHDGRHCIAAEPTEPQGSIWRCECSQYWVVYYQPDSYVNVSDGGPRWRRASWRERRRAQQASR